MEYYLMIGGAGFRILSDFRITIEESFGPFLYTSLPNWDVTIEFFRDFRQAPRPVGAKCGEDLLLEFYAQDDGLLCLAKGGWKGPLAITRCEPTFSHLVCCINAANFELLNSLGSLLRLVPMRRILQHRDVLFFHAAQIALGDSSVLFTAPSGTGKTTQAKLWREARDARIICNDRTLVCGGHTYGYPIDGSEPVCSGEVHSLGAVVYLTQSPQNRIQRLKPSAALAKLMPQLVFDTWDPGAGHMVMTQLVKLLEQYPVYQLDCTPDEAAVICLEECLKKDGVIG